MRSITLKVACICLTNNSFHPLMRTQVTVRTRPTAWSFSPITQTATPAMGRMLINVAAPMAARSAQVFIPCHPFQVHTLQRQLRAMQCRPRNIYRRMTNCSQRTGECLSISLSLAFAMCLTSQGEGEHEKIKLFIYFSRKSPFSWKQYLHMTYTCT